MAPIQILEIESGKTEVVYEFDNLSKFKRWICWFFNIVPQKHFMYKAEITVRGENPMRPLNIVQMDNNTTWRIILVQGNTMRMDLLTITTNANLGIGKSIAMLFQQYEEGTRFGHKRGRN